MQQQQRRRRVLIKKHHPDDHYNHFSPCFIILLITGGLGIIVWVFAASSTSSASHTFARDDIVQKEKQSRPCTTGEYMHRETGRCLPVERYPNAADPWIMDTSVSACDSFFKHSCGKWITEHTNEDRAFSAAYVQNHHTVVTAIQGVSGDHPVATFYASCVATVVKGQYSRESLRETRYMITRMLGSFRKHSDLPRIFGRMARIGYTLPFAVAIEKHPLENSMIPLLRWNGFEATEVSEEYVSALFVGGRAKGASLMDAALNTNMFLKIQRALNAHHVQVEDDVESFSAYLDAGLMSRDLTSVAHLQDPNGHWSWREFFEGIDGTAFGKLALDTEPIWCPDKRYIHWIVSNLEAFTVAEWTAYLKFSIIYHNHDFVPSLPSNVYFKEHEYSPLGTVAARNMPHNLRRLGAAAHARYTELDCAAMTQRLLPGLVSRLFLHDTFGPDTESIRVAIQRLGERIRDQVATSVAATTWLDGTTRRNLERKVRAIIVRAVHPNIWETEPFGDSLAADRYMHNLNQIRAWRVRQNSVLWSDYATDTTHRINRDTVARFGAPLSTVNAFYSPISNTITVFAGILRPPFYDKRYSVASVLASVGSILGHEFSHSIDSNGARFDANGNFRRLNDGWITRETMARFREHQQCVVDEYNVHDLNVDCASAAGRRKRDAYGEQTLGENMADIVGVRSAYETYLQLANATEQNDSARRWYWIVFAQMWCESYDQKHLCARISSDEHSTSLFRVDKTLRNIPYFAQDNGCIPGVDRMARTETDRCILYGE